ncbi:ATP-binding protein [Coralliovum pocilloporae]|uniref:ATP-binding protein n=1 Tax=Coralliovum pocilloporae TaxID=3066369 RepID=UPI003306D376
MAGPTHFLTKNPNAFAWPSVAETHNEFERLIYRYIQQSLAIARDKVTIELTPRKHDKGKDIIVEAIDVDFCLFGINFPASRTGIRLYVECKTTTAERLDESFLSDMSQHHYQEASAYILVTNGTITPYVLHRGIDSWATKDINFFIVDRYRLVSTLLDAGLEHYALNRHKISLPTSHQLPDFDKSEPVICYQYEAADFGQSDKLRLYLSISNYSDDFQPVQLSLTSDITWGLSEQPVAMHIKPGETQVRIFEAQALTVDEKSQIRFDLDCNAKHHKITITPNVFMPMFEPSFIGNQHFSIRDKLKRIFDRDSTFHFISLQGEAGAGKTRTVEEAVKPFQGSGNFIAKLSFESDGRLHYVNHLQELQISRNDFEHNDRSIDTLMSAAIDYGLPVILIIEDAHHAQRTELQALKNWMTETRECRWAVTLIVTGRDDHTFPNDEYFSLLSLTRQIDEKYVHDFKLNKLTDSDSKKLIDATAVDFPQNVRTSIQKLGDNNPFIIFEVFLYLVDMDVAEFASRRTVGLLEPEIFASKDDLPTDVKTIYEKRLNALAQADGGSLALDFLTVASFFGFTFDQSIWVDFFDGEESSTPAKRLLVERFFLKFNSGEPSFFHENLLHETRKYVISAKRVSETIRIFRTRPGMLQRLPDFVQAEIHTLAGDYEKVFEILSPIWEQLIKIENFSALEIDRQFFRFIPTLFEAATKLNKEENLLATVATAYSYMAVHNFPLLQAIECCNRAEQWVSHIEGKIGRISSKRAAIMQLRAHARQNIGRTGEALRDMLELLANMEQGGPDWDHAVRFDLYDRLQEHYRKTNHEVLSDHFGALALQEAKIAGDPSLQLCHAITRAGRYLYCGKKKAQNHGEIAFNLAKASSIKRLQIYTRLTLLVIDAIYDFKNLERMNAVYDEARDMLRLCTHENYTDSIMRIELLLAVISLFRFDDPEKALDASQFFVTSGLDDSIRYGNGLFDWAFYNLAAVLAEARSDRDRAERYFENCRLMMKRRGIAFMGERSAIYPTPLVLTNLTRFAAQKWGENQATTILKSTADSYANRDLFDKMECTKLVQITQTGRPIFWKVNRATGPRQTSTGYFAVLF